MARTRVAKRSKSKRVSRSAKRSSKPSVRSAPKPTARKPNPKPPKPKPTAPKKLKKSRKPKPKASAPKPTPRHKAKAKARWRDGLGYDPVYPQSVRMGERVIARLLANMANPLTGRCPLVAMEMQAGKTGLIAAIIAMIVESCQDRNRTFQIVVLTGLSDLALTAQTRDRLFMRSEPMGGGSGACLHTLVADSGLARYPRRRGSEAQIFQHGIVVSNCATRLKYIDLNMSEVDERYILLDEAHAGNGQWGCIDTFLRRHGVYLHEPIARWGNETGTINHVIPVSATPNAFLIKSDFVSLAGDKLFEVVYEPPPSSYTGLREMFKAGRLKETQPYTPDFLDMLWDEAQEAERKLGPGYIVIRAMGEKHAALIRHVKAKGQPVMEFDLRTNNLADLNDQFGMVPPQHQLTWLVIRGSMRAGMTIPRKHYIRCWVESRSVNADTMAQAGLGRACGHHRNDSYPIYCVMKHALDYIKMYEALEAGSPLWFMPAGVKNKEMKPAMRYSVALALEPRAMDADDPRQQLKPSKRESQWYDIWLKWVKPHVSTSSRKQLNRISDNVYNDCAALLMLGKRDSGSTLGYIVDGPTSDAAVEKFIRTYCGKGRHKNTTPDMVRAWARRNRASWAALKAAHPEWIGKAVIYDVALEPDFMGAMNESRDDLLRTTCALRSEQTRQVRDLDLHKKSVSDAQESLDAMIVAFLREQVNQMR